MDALPPENVLESVSKSLSETSMSKDALVKLLKKAETALSHLCSSSALQATLISLSCSLVQNNLLKHKDEDVKLLVAVCFTEIFRLLAPNPSFHFEEFKDIFRLIISVFKRLTDSNSSYSARRLKILETVAYCKSFLFMVGSFEDLAAEMFDVFFKAVRYNIHKSSVQAIFSIITNILELKVAPRILEVILHNLLRQEKTASFRLAVCVIQECAPKLENSVCSFLTSCMLDKDNVHKSHETDWSCVDGDDGHDGLLDNDPSGAELRSSYHEVILIIYQCSPQILTSVLSCLTQELLVDDRIKAVHLVGKLLVLSRLDFGLDHRSVFSEFLRRFSDKSPEVRLAALECAKAAYQCNTTTDEAHRILVAVEGRLLDYDDKVRTQAISVICNLASSNLSYFPLELVVKAIKRLRDKKISVRKAAMRSLLELYRIYCIKCSHALFSLNFEYEKIPCGVLMLCFDKDCKEFRPQNLELVLAGDLFPPSLSASDRKKHWIALFSLFRQPHLMALRFILIQKRSLQFEMQAYLTLRCIEKVNGSEDQIKFFEFFSKMASTFLDSSKAKGCFQRLHDMKDRHIFKSLQQLVDEHTSHSDSCTVRVAFLERIGKKNPDYDFFKILTLRCSYTIFNAELVQSILEDIVSEKCSVDNSLLCPAEFILFIVKMFPSLLKGSEDLLLQLSSDSTALTNEKLLHILAIAGHHVSIKLSDIYPFLEKMCLLGSRTESKFAVRAISSLIDSSDCLTFSNLCKKLVSSLQSGQNMPTILQTLSFVARCSFRTFEPYEKQVTDLIVQNIFSSTKLECSLDETLLNGDLSCSCYCKLKIYGMKAMVKCFLSNRATQVNQQIKEIMDILRNTIQGEGIICNNILSVIDKDCLRLSSAKLLLQFAARFDCYIPPNLFHVIIARARDSSCSVRKMFLSKLHELLTENLIPIRYACSFALASTDFISDIRSDSIKHLLEFIGHQRNSFNQHTSSQDEREQIINSPEYIVVFLIHYLAHDQGFPLKCLDDEDFYPEFCSPLVIMLRALLDLEDLCGNSGDTLSNLFVILCAIKKADDAVDAQITQKLHVLSDIAMLILKMLGKDLKPSKMCRMVFLPSSFYKVYQGPSKVDCLRKIVDETFVKRIIDVVDPSIIKTSRSKQYSKSQQGDDYMGAIKDYSDNELNLGSSHGKELLRKRTAQPLKISPIDSISTDSHKENSYVNGTGNLTPQTSDANFSHQQLSSHGSVSTEVYFSTSQAINTEPEDETLNSLLTKQGIRKCDSIAFHSDKFPNCLCLKESVDKGKGPVCHAVCIYPPVKSSEIVDSDDSQKRRHEDPCSIHPGDSNIIENASNMQATVLTEGAGDYESINCPSIVGAKKKKQKQPLSATENNSLNSDLIERNVCKASRRTRLRRA